MRDRAGAVRADGQSGIPRFRECDEFGDGVHRHRWIDHEDYVIAGRKSYEFKIPEGIVKCLLEEDWVDGEAVDVEQDSVAIRRRSRDLRGADAAARTADILDIKLLSELLAEFLHDHPRENVGRTAG